MHIEDINRDPALIYYDFFLTVWIADLLYSFALTATKLAILACYWRIFNVTSIKLPIKGLVTLVIGWLIVRVSASCSSSLASIETNTFLDCSNCASLQPSSRLLGQVHIRELHHRRSNILHGIGDTPFVNRPHNSRTTGATYQESPDQQA
jgi:hypothetical protein